MQVPQVGDKCCADPEFDGTFLYGVITMIVDGLAWSNLQRGFFGEFCGDIPTHKRDGVWVFNSF